MSGKTHKGLSKRLKRTAGGKLFRRGTGRRHLLSNKSGKQSRHQKKWKGLSKSDRKCFEHQFGKL